MRVTVKAHGDLPRFLRQRGGKAELDLDGPMKVREALGRLGIPLDEVWRVSLNGQLVSEEQPLQDGDEVRVFSAVTGGAHATG
ncbi:MAG: MoaD/ThiS family protein [Chloroflexi bacterium]|nr:MoaD/ThiS family protein [Chloroflexota bacterium]